MVSQRADVVTEATVIEEEDGPIRVGAKVSAAKSGPSGISRDSKAKACRPRRDIRHVSTKDSRLTLALESASRQIALSSECERAFPANKRSDNSRSGMISENDRITC